MASPNPTVLSSRSSKKNEYGVAEEKIVMTGAQRVHQLFENESCTYTYILEDIESKKAVIIDSVIETVERDLTLVRELGLELVYIFDTHIHADHITGAGELRRKTKAKTGISEMAGVQCADLALNEKSDLRIGKSRIRIISTPGHTDSCLSFVFGNCVFTGDALLIRGCGRTDFQQGSAEKLFSSVREKLFLLPDETLVYPGHDYRGQTASTIALEKKFNPRLKLELSMNDFVQIMAELKLANPKKIQDAVPANLLCGRARVARVFNPQIVDGVPEVKCEDLFLKLKDMKALNFLIVDIRSDEEVIGQFGSIAGAVRASIGQGLDDFFQAHTHDQEIVFVCESGRRSREAALKGMTLGFNLSLSLSGGMLRWNECQFSIRKS